MKQVIYYRRISKASNESGLGLESQLQILNHFYSECEVIGEFVEMVGGGDIENRPELKKAIQLSKETGAVLCIAKCDRLARNTEQALQIYRELEGNLESCDIPNLDEFTLTLFQAIATREKQLIQIRTKNALKIKVEQCGEWRTGNQSFIDGSVQSQASKSKTKKASDNLNNKRALAFIQNIDHENKSLRQMASLLNENGFVTSRGKEFKPATIQMLMKRVA